MRSTVSGPVHSCSTPLSSPKKYAAVELLTRETLYFTVEPKSRAKELFAQICLHLGNQGMVDVDLFGLAIASDGEYLFVDPDSKLSKYAPKNWRSSHGQGLDTNGCPLLVLYFRVQFYVDSPLLLRDKVTRHHYYLQLRRNAISADRWQAGAGTARHGGSSSVDEEEEEGGGGCMGPGAAVAALCLLAGLALQADLGDREGDRINTSEGICGGVRSRRRGGSERMLGESGGSDGEAEDVGGRDGDDEEEEGTDEEVAAATEPYFAPGEYLPPQLQDTMAVRAVEAHHRGLHGLNRGEAELQYIREAAAASSTPASAWAPEEAQLSPPRVPPLRLNLHLYRLNKSKKPEQASGSAGGQSGSTPGPNSAVWLGICARGIEIYEESEEKALMSTFLWSNIGKLCFERKKFEIRALNWPGAAARKFTYYSSSDEKSKHLLSLCRLTHQFSMAMQPRLAEVRRREEEERKRMRDLCPLLLELSIAKEGSGNGSSHHRALATHALRHALFPGHVGGHRVHGTHGSQCKGHGDQRVSVISNTSSNTTSGIVSDRVQSLDESEDDLEMEIMINSPPAPSVESLALAHLRDGEDSPIPPPTSPSPAPSADSQDGILENSEKEKNEISQSTPVRKTNGAPTPPTDGSQCSSSCSTVVNPSNSSNPAEATSTTPAPTRVGSAHSSCSQRSGHSLLSLAKSSSGAPTSPNCHGRVTPHRHQNRRASPGSGHIVTHPHIRTASDLSVGTCSTGSEIGFGHTAQNSVSSSPGDVGNCGSESNAGESSEGDVRVSEKKESEEKSEEVPSPQLEEQNLDYSVQSAHSYGCPPRRRSTVSSTLDTDSDYVRLPLRPITSLSDSDSFFESSPTPPPPPPRDESSGAKVGNYVYLDPAPRPISMGCVTTITQAADEVDGRLIVGPSFSPRPPPPPPPVTSMTTSEANARFITTRPHINILTAHTTTPAVASPSFAAPTAAQQQLRAYPPGDARTHPPAVHPRPPQLLPSPVVARGLAVQHRTSPHRHLSIGSTGCAEELAAKMKPTVSSSGHSPILPVIGPNNYLDVHASKVMANHRHNHHHHQQHPKQRSGLLRGTIQSPKKSHQVSRGHPVSPVVSPLPSPLMAHQPRPQPTYLCGPTTCGVAHRHHRHQHHHHHAPCMTHHTVSHNGGSPGSVSPAAPQPSLATVYTNQVTQSQIEQYKQQLYSDVDYVIYPMKDPALSKQEYMDAKQGSTLMAHLQQQQYNSHHHHHHFHGGYPTVLQPPPPPYRGPTKSGILYRSTPNVSGGTVTGTYGVPVHHPANGIPFSQHRIVTAPKYASNQNLSCGGGSSASTSTNSTVNSYMSEMAPFPGLRPFLSTQSLALTPAPAYSFYSASTQNLTRGMYEQQQHTLPPPPPPMPKGGGEFMQVSIPTLPTLAGHLEFGRTRSDDNILNIDKQQGTITGRQYYRLPPPPPYDPSVNAGNVSVNGNPAPESSPQVSVPQQSPSSSSSDETKKADGMLDIRTLREKSKNLDLPLISALCNDRSLLKQTNAFVAHPTHREGEGTAFVAEAESQRHKGRPVSWHVEGSMVPGNANNSPAEAPIPTPSVVETAPQPNSSSTSQTQSPSPSIQETHKPRISRGHLSDLKIGGAVSPNGPVGSCSTNLAAFTKSSKHSYSVSPSKKYPVSGLSTTQISKPQRKVSSCTHTHPQDPRVVLVPGITTLGATSGSASVVMAGLKGPASATKTRIGLKQKANVVP